MVVDGKYSLIIHSIFWWKLSIHFCTWKYGNVKTLWKFYSWLVPTQTVSEPILKPNYGHPLSPSVNQEGIKRELSHAVVKWTCLSVINVWGLLYIFIRDSKLKFYSGRMVWYNRRMSERFTPTRLWCFTFPCINHVLGCIGFVYNRDLHIPLKFSSYWYKSIQYRCHIWIVKTTSHTKLFKQSYRAVQCVYNFVDSCNQN